MKHQTNLKMFTNNNISCPYRKLKKLHRFGVVWGELPPSPTFPTLPHPPHTPKLTPNWLKLGPPTPKLTPNLSNIPFKECGLRISTRGPMDDLANFKRRPSRYRFNVKVLDVLPISIRGPSRFQAWRLVVLSIFKGAPSGFEKGCPGCPFTFKEGLFEREWKSNWPSI